MKVEEPAQEAVHQEQVLGPGRQPGRAGLGLAEPVEQFPDVVADRDDAFPRDLVSDQVGDQETDQQFALDRGETDGSPGPRAERSKLLTSLLDIRT